jgi:uncharacterized cofD-like protein
VAGVENGKNGNTSGGRPGQHWQLLFRWFEPGLGVKRWLVLMVLATALIGLGLAIILLDYYRTHPDATWLYIVSLRALPRWARASLLGVAGLSVLGLAVVGLNRALLAPFMRPGKSVVEVVSEHRRRGRGPRIVAIGGGTGLATLLRGLKAYSGNLTAIVTVADDGGSSGRLRRSLGLPPPGDLRNCLAALSDDEQLITQLFQYRFPEGELAGHSFGNLFIAALAGVTGGFDTGLSEAGRVLAIRGRVLPSTLTDVSLVADKTAAMDVRAVRIRGESRIPNLPGQIHHLHLEPDDPPAYPEAIQAILNAEMIVIGPGSLFTSILPNLLVKDITKAIHASRAFKVYVCNVATQPGETDAFDCGQHVAALEQHVGRGVVDVVLANDWLEANLPGSLSFVKPDCKEVGVPHHTADLADRSRPWRHDSDKLADELVAMLEERTGPLDLPSVGDEIEPTSGLN